VPGIVRKGDVHQGHASPTPNPKHTTSYVGGSTDVFVNSQNVQRIGDTTDCGDPATGGSPDIYVNSIAVHRRTDATGGHGSWVPNAAASASTDVFANDGTGFTPPVYETPEVVPVVVFFKETFKETTTSYASNIQSVGTAEVPVLSSGEPYPYQPEQVDTFDEVPKPSICGEGQFVNPYDLASSYLGGDTWKELHKQGGTNPMIKGLWDEIGYNGSGFADSTAWCAVLVGAILKRANCTYKKTASSQAYSGHGLSVANLDDARIGDIIVFYRKGTSSGLGHVGFYAGTHTSTHVSVLGGNQGDDLNVRSFKRADSVKGWGITAIRRPVSCSDGTTEAPISGSVAIQALESDGSVT
jgi:uncharacterized protein (TIGR02594 family)